MKPRTALEIEIAKINAKVKEDISLCDKKIIIKNIKFDENFMKIKSGEYVYFNIKESRKGFELDRLYRIYCFKNKTGPNYMFFEVVRKYTKGRSFRIFSKKRYRMNSWTPYDTFTYASDIELRSNEKDYYGDWIGGLFKYSEFSIKRHAGKRCKCIQTDPKLINKIVKIPYGETLFNQGDDILIKELSGRSNMKEYLSSIRIAKKHGFVFTSVNVGHWFDMIYCMLFTGNDNHNPKFVAPKDLDKMHHFFIDKANKKTMRERVYQREQARLEQEGEDLAQLEQDKKINEDYIKRRQRFYDMIISNSKFDIHVLRDVKEFYEEGINMSHCVFACKYYKKPDSLILSCRNKKGERIETVEVDLIKFKVLQCYGYKDQFTEYHNEILDLMRKNMNKIRLYNRKKESSKTVLRQAI